MRILGIDPGSQATGYGVVEQALVGAAGRGLAHVAHGTLRAPRGAAMSGRLALLHAGVLEVIRAHSPDVAVVERVFVAASPRSALVLGQARGVALAALGALGVPVLELDTREVKQAVVGTGAASKVQVQAMVVRLLGLEARPAPDAADALAAAICHAHRGRLGTLIPSGAIRRRARARRHGAGWVVRRVR
jgi:crossover junction endodeoxyribonuclease RuvC